MSRYIESAGFENGNTFIVTLENGMVQNIELPEGLSTNGKNMMRALASILQMDVTGRDEAVWTRLERSIHGDCEVEYAKVKGNRNDILEVTKSMSQLRDCRIRNMRMFDNSDAQTCNRVKYDYYNDWYYNNQKKAEQTKEVRQDRLQREERYRPEPVHASTMTSFIMKEKDTQNLEIEKIFSTGSVTVQRFNVEGPTYMTIANRTLHLIEKKPIGQLNQVLKPKLYKDLEFEWLEEELRWDEVISVEQLKSVRSKYSNGYVLDERQEDIIETLKLKIKNHVEADHQKYVQPIHQREEAVRRLHENSIREIIPLLENLHYDNLKQLKDYYIAQARTTADDELITQKNMFLEILPVTGTLPSALLIRDIILNNELLSDLENAKLIASMPFHLRPIKTIVDQFFQLIQQRNAKPHLSLPLTRRATDLAYAHMVRRTCVEKATEETCFKALNIEEFIQKFDRLSEDDVKEQKHLMMVFRNFEQSDILERRLVSILRRSDNKNYKSDVRTQAVFSLAERAVRMGRELEYFLPIFLERDEGHEIRIAAFDALLRGKLTETTVNKILLHMIMEPDNEVFNYVYTTFERLENAYNEPCQQELRFFAKYFTKYWRQNMWQKPKYSFGLSKTYSNFFINEKHGYAGSMDVKMLGYHKTMAPLSVQVDVRSQRYQHVTIRDMGLYVRMEGITARIVEKIRTMTRIGQLNLDELKEILLKDFQIRQRDDIPAKLDLALMVRNKVVLTYQLEDREIMDTIKDVNNWIMSIKNIENVYRINKNFGLVWDRLKLEMPTDFGMPMAYKKDALTLISLNGEMKKQTGLKAELKLRLNWHTFNMEKMMTVHPTNKIQFAIAQSRVFKHQLRTAFLGEVDTAARRLMVSMIVPEQEEPMSYLGHSQTFLYTSENKLELRNQYLERSCPKCENMLLISRGKDLRRNVELLESYRRYFEVYGINIDANLFDCELPEAISTGQNFYQLLHSFNPISKEPKNFFNILLSGFRQTQAFLFYFPRVQSCGLNILLRRSATEPVKEIKMVLDMKKYEVLERPRQLFNERTVAIAGELVFKGHVQRVHKIDLEYRIKPNFQNFESRLDIDIRRHAFTLKGKTYPEWPLVVNMKTIPQPKNIDRPFLMQDLIKMQRYGIRSNIKMQLGNPETRLVIEGDYKTTAEGAEYLRNTWYYKRCLEEKQLPHWATTETIPQTDACLYSLEDMMTLRQYNWDITATKLPAWTVNLYKKLEAVLKTTLFPFWKLDAVITTHEINPREPKIRVETVLRPETQMVDLTLRHDKEVSRFMGIKYEYINDWMTEPYRRLQSYFRLPLPMLTTSVSQETAGYLYYNQHINRCAVTQNTVRTYDNVTYTYNKKDTCWTLISADCVEQPTFAVFIKRDEQVQTRPGLLVIIGNVKVEFQPVNDIEYRIYVKGFKQTTFK